MPPQTKTSPDRPRTDGSTPPGAGLERAISQVGESLARTLGAVFSGRNSALWVMP